MLRVAIVGCGKIAEQHAEEIQYIPGCRLVAACDQEELMARQFCERYRIRQSFSDLEQLLVSAKPDVVHITTPPQSHFQLGMQCLAAGCNVYIEKPFTVDAKEAEELIRFAEEKNLKVTAGHNAQFSHASLRMRQLIKEGFLGGPPVHMEAYYCYNFGDPAFAKALLGDSNHWVRSLPGKLLQNVISHGMAKIAELLTTDHPRVIAHGFTSPLLQSINETDITDELRVIIHDNNGATAYFTFSSRMRPVLHQLRIYGPQNGLLLDDDHQTLIKLHGSKYKSYLDHVMPSLDFARQYIANVLRNMYRFARRDFQMNWGMRHLIAAFYKSIEGKAPLPIPYREIILTTRIMDTIFEQLASSSS